MPGTGHSGRYRGSISNRNGKPAFQVLAPWNSRKNGEKGQVAISQGTDRVKFQNLDAQQMANYNAGNNTFNMNNNFTVAGGTTLVGGTTLNSTVTVNADINQPNLLNTTTVGTLNVLNNATYNQNLTVGGNFTVNGTTTTVNSKIVDISDSIIKVNDVHCDQKGNKSHGVLFEYNSQHDGLGGNSLIPQNGFFGVQRKIGPDINTHILGADNASGSVGVFTYYTKDISDNSGGALQLTDGSFNIPSGLLGDALFNNLDLCGNLTGYNTFQIKNGDGTQGTIWMRANDISMNAVNNIDITGGTGVKLTEDSSGAYIDISGGNIDIAGATSNKISLVANGNILLNSNYGTSSNIEIHNNQGDSANAIALTATAGGVDIDAGTSVTIDAAAASNFTTTAGILTLDGAAGVDISGNAGTVNITTTGTVDINAGPLDISASTVDIDATSSVTIDAAAASNFTTSVGTLTLDGAAGVNIAGNASEVDITTTGPLDINAAATTIDSSAGVSIDAAAASNFTTSAGILTLDGAGGVNIAGNASEVDITTTGPLDINAAATTIDSSAGVSIDAAAASNFTTSVGTLTLDGAAGVNIAGNASEVDITTTGALDINAAATTIDSSAGVSIDAAAASNFTTSVGTLTLDGAAGVNIAGNASEVDITTTGALDINAAATTIDSSAGVSIDAAAASNFTTSVGTLTLDGAAGVNIAGNASEVDITTTGALDINAAATTIDSSAGVSIDAAAASNFTTSSGALTLDGASGVNIAGNASEVDITTTGTVDINAGPLDIDASDKITITSAANAADAITVKATVGGIDIKANGPATGENDIDITAVSSVNIKSTEADIKAITICAENGKVQIDGDDGVNIGTGGSGCTTSGSVTIQAGAGNSIVLNSDISANGDIDAAGQTATFGLVVTDELNLLNNFTIGNIGNSTNNYILFGPGAVIGNGVINTAGGALNIPTTNLLNSVNIREDLTWISNDGAGTYQKTEGNEGATLKGGSLIVDGNMLFGAARGRTGAYDQGPEVNVTYPGDGNQRRLLDMNCNDMSGIRILSFGKEPIGDWKSNGTNTHTTFWGSDLSGCNYGFIDLACGLMVDISGLHFCDASASSITAGNSLDVSSNAVHFFNRGSATNPGHGPNGHGGPGGTNNIQIDISGNLRVGGGTAAQDPSSNVVLDVSWNNQGQGLAATQNSAVAIRTNRLSDGAISIGATSGGGVDISGSSTTDGGNAPNGQASGAISISSTAGGMGLAWNDAKRLWAEGGRAIITANENAADSIKLHAASSDTDQTIYVLNTAGTDVSAVKIEALAGGVDIDAAAGKDVDISGGQVLLGNKDDVVGAISLTTNIGTSETIVVTNTQGTSNSAIIIDASAGGVNIDAATGKDVDISGGQVLLGNKDDVVGAISLTTNIGTSETIVVTNTQGTSNSAIIIDASAGGVNIDAATGKDVDISGGQVLLGNKDDVVGAISLTTNIGTSETIVVTNTQGTNATAIALTATAGGIKLQANGTSPNGQISIDSTNAPVLIAGGANSSFTTSVGDLTLEATAESVKINTGTNKPIEINGAAGAIGSVLTSMGSSLRPIWSMETTVPIGGIMMWTGAAAPTNWQICDGLTFVALDYPTLNTRLGGNTRPNMTGLFVRGFESGVTSAVGAPGGQADNKIGTTHLPSHSHAITDPGHTHTATVTPGSGHKHTVPLGVNNGSNGFHGADDISAGNTVDTSSSTANPTVSNSPSSTGITLGNTGGGNAYTPSHYVVYYIIYAGPVGA